MNLWIPVQPNSINTRKYGPGKLYIVSPVDSSMYFKVSLFSPVTIWHGVHKNQALNHEQFVKIHGETLNEIIMKHYLFIFI